MKKLFISLSFALLWNTSQVFAAECFWKSWGKENISALAERLKDEHPFWQHDTLDRLKRNPAHPDIESAINTVVSFLHTPSNHPWYRFYVLMFDNYLNFLADTGPYHFDLIQSHIFAMIANPDLPEELRISASMVLKKIVDVRRLKRTSKGLSTPFHIAKNPFLYIRDMISDDQQDMTLRTTFVTLSSALIEYKLRLIPILEKQLNYTLEHRVFTQTDGLSTRTDPDTLTFIKSLLHALGELGKKPSDNQTHISRETVQKIISLLKNTKDPSLAFVSALALAKIDPKSQDYVSEVLKKSVLKNDSGQFLFPGMNSYVLPFIVDHNSNRIPRILHSLIQDRHLFYLNSLRPAKQHIDKIIETLKKIIQSKNGRYEHIQSQALYFLGYFGKQNDEALTFLISILKEHQDYSHRVRRDAVITLGEMGGRAKKALPVLKAYISQVPKDVNTKGFIGVIHESIQAIRLNDPNLVKRFLWRFRYLHFWWQPYRVWPRSVHLEFNGYP